MKRQLFLIVATVLFFDHVQSEVFIPRRGLPPAGPPELRADSPEWGNSTQLVDHFDPTNNSTFTMRYLSNKQFYEAGGPMFVMLGGEWTISEDWLQTGQMYDMAKNHSGYMFYVEHRYFGESIPTSDMSLKNLEYLTTDQALADFHDFILEMKRNIPDLALAKVVVVGGSYAANLALWMRARYPDDIHAAYSSSGPLLAKVDFFEYKEVLQSAMGDNCSAIVTRAIEEIQNKLKTPEGINAVKNDFNLCAPLDTTKSTHVEYFFNTLANKLGVEIQYANQNTVSNICTQLSAENKTDYERLANYAKTTSCRGNFDNYVSYLKKDGGSRAWHYLECTQFGFFLTTNSENQPFGDTVSTEMFTSGCQEIYGAQFTTEVTQGGVDLMNAFNGGLEPQVTRVVSVHGTIDPWHPLGLARNLSESAPVFVVKGTSHCLDMNSVRSSDIEEMKYVKNRVKKYIADWLLEDDDVV